MFRLAAPGAVMPITFWPVHRAVRDLAVADPCLPFGVCINASRVI